MNDWRKRERERLQKDIFDPEKSYVKGDVRYWKSNDAVIPPFVYKDAGIECPTIQQKEYDREISEFCKAYKEAQQSYQPTPEEEAEHMFELRAAFGPGETVVDIISGKTYRT